MKLYPAYDYKLAPCFSMNKKGEKGCYAGNDIPNLMFLVANRRFREAFYLLKETNPFPGGTGRFCDHPCEAVCNRGKFDSPVDIKYIERFIADYGYRHNIMPVSTKVSKKQKIAVIGGGVAGLSAAYFLRKNGYYVDVYEKHRYAGGMLVEGIPVFRYPDDIYRYEIEYIKAVGVKVHTESEIKQDDFIKLTKEYNAVIIAVGAHKPRLLNIKGENLPNVLVGLDFLKAINLHERMRGSKQDIDFVIRDVKKRMRIGDKVGVIGGGYTAIDVARTLIRIGVKEVYVIYRRNYYDMNIHKGEKEECEKEGIKFRFLLSPYMVEKKGKKIRVIFQKMKEAYETEGKGKHKIFPIEGAYEVYEFDNLIKAIGEMPDLDFVHSDGEINDIIYDVAGFSNVYIVGDARMGYADDVGMVVRAIGSARRAADEIRRSFGEDIPVPDYTKIAHFNAIDTRYFEERQRLRIESLPYEQRKGFDEVVSGIDEDEAVVGASRCFNCGICIKCDMCYNYSYGSIAKLNEEWMPDRKKVYYRFIKERVNYYTQLVVDKCPRNAMSLVSEDEKEDIEEQYISLKGDK